MNFDGEQFFAKMAPAVGKAFEAMSELEKGAIANPDENRMVGHYWLRNPELAPDSGIRQAIEGMLAQTRKFAADIHSGAIQGRGGKFANVLVVGIGGSALGPQFVANALGQPGGDRMKLFFFDNTDPDGMARVLASIGPDLKTTLCVVISKSGGTKETRNGMLIAKAAYEAQGLSFPEFAVAITGAKSELDGVAVKENWLARFPMWDWVGGRTSETSAVGLVPAALQGVDIDQILAGARACDRVTRSVEVKANPAALLALMWYSATGGKGLKDMVIIPYKDRLELFSKYLQQLVMESLGKEKDLKGATVNQGLAVYGNKGSTDQHAYVQQLRDGVNNFFVTLIRVLRDGEKTPFYVEPRVTSGDYLDGFLLGTRRALFEKDRESITLTIQEVTPFSVGVLIALYERAVGLYAALVGINAYHQPGVEGGKKAATDHLKLQLQVMEMMRRDSAKEWTVDRLADAIGAPEEAESVFHVLEHLSANPGRGVTKKSGSSPVNGIYRVG